MPQPLVAVIMGSKSDWETMRHCDETLTQFGVAHECRVLSAHRTPQLASQYAAEAESRGFEVIVAGSGVMVSCFCPGATATGFAKRAGTEDSRLFKKLRPMNVEDVARDWGCPRLSRRDD